MCLLAAVLCAPRYPSVPYAREGPDVRTETLDPRPRVNTEASGVEGPFRRTCSPSAERTARESTVAACSTAGRSEPLRRLRLTVPVASVPGMTHQRPDFELHRPGALIAALPAVLGFVPEKSLVVVSVGDGEMGAVMRVDLSDGLAQQVAQLAEVAAAAEPEAAIAVIVDADGAGCPVCNEDYRELGEALTAALTQYAIDLWAVHVVDRIAAGGRWHCVDGCGAGGLIDDPSASPVAAAAVLDGRRLYARRADLQAVVAVAEPGRSADLAVALAECEASRAAAHGADPDGCGRHDVEEIDGRRRAARRRPGGLRHRAGQAGLCPGRCAGPRHPVRLGRR